MRCSLPFTRFARATAVLLAVAVAGCAPRTTAGSDAAASGTHAAATERAAGAGADAGDVAALRAQQQDLIAALPLARHVHCAQHSPASADSFEFEGFFSGPDLICVKVTAPAQWDSTGTTAYTYARGRMLGLHNEFTRKPATGPSQRLVEDVLFAGDGSIADASLTLNGLPRRIEPRAFLRAMADNRRLAAQAYSVVWEHRNE